MIKLFKKLALSGVEMYIRYSNPNNPMIIHVDFKLGKKVITRAIDLSEFTNVWGGDHVLENVLERYLDEFLDTLHKENIKAFGRLATDA